MSNDAFTNWRFEIEGVSARNERTGATLTLTGEQAGGRTFKTVDPPCVTRPEELLAPLTFEYASSMGAASLVIERQVALDYLENKYGPTPPKVLRRLLWRLILNDVTIATNGCRIPARDLDPDALEDLTTDLYDALCFWQKGPEASNDPPLKDLTFSTRSTIIVGARRGDKWRAEAYRQDSPFGTIPVWTALDTIGPGGVRKFKNTLASEAHNPWRYDPATDSVSHVRHGVTLRNLRAVDAKDESSRLFAFQRPGEKALTLWVGIGHGERGSYNLCEWQVSLEPSALLSNGWSLEQALNSERIYDQRYVSDSRFNEGDLRAMVTFAVDAIFHWPQLEGVFAKPPDLVLVAGKQIVGKRSYFGLSLSHYLIFEHSIDMEREREEQAIRNKALWKGIPS